MLNIIACGFKVRFFLAPNGQGQLRRRVNPYASKHLGITWTEVRAVTRDQGIALQGHGSQQYRAVLVW